MKANRSTVKDWIIVKKLMFITLFSLCCFASSAQEGDSDLYQERALTEEDNFSEVTLDELLDEVKFTIEMDFPMVTLHKVHVNDDGHYKLEITLENGVTKTLFLDEDGSFINKPPN